MEFVVLAVTKSFDGFCIAGMDKEGNWIRPISRNSPGRFWNKEELTSNGQFVRPGDVWEISGSNPKVYDYSNHTEDFILTSRKVLTPLSLPEFFLFLSSNLETNKTLNDTFEANKRSLCLVKADIFRTYTTNYDGKLRARMIFSSNNYDFKNPKTNDGNIIVKDCKWESIILQEVTLRLFTKMCLYVSV
ncbi:hypothetical protein MT997_13735 [Paenibacillus sp. OVF10]|nr:hypothetical protein MT997_13735 [Paenibacillus sp. OVF10]